MGQSIFWLSPILIFFFFLHHDFVYCSPQFLSSSTDKHLTPYKQKLALFQFKLILGVGININPSPFCDNAFGNPSRSKTMNWSMSSDCCTWEGVTCKDSTGDIIGIDLSCSQLEGSILPNSTLFHLSQLEALNLAFNNFSGPLPQEFSLFAGNLMHLNLSYSGFDVKISSENFKILMQNLTQLREISLNGIDISSVLPMNLSTSLRYLDLSGTCLHGEIPQEVFHLPHLEVLELSHNTNLAGNLPDVKWGSSSTLRSLGLGFTSLSGKIPDSIGYLTSLNNLDLHGCNLSGPIPRSIRNLSQLYRLVLSQNHLSFQIPNVFDNLKNLTRLSLGGNHLNGPFPYSVIGLRELTFLDLSFNSLIGPLPSNLKGSSLRKLAYIHLENNSLNGTIPSWLFALPSLELVHISYNRLTGHLDGYQYSKSLMSICFEDNILSGHIPQSILELVNLSVLDLSNNRIDGHIPHWVGSTGRGSLGYLNISHNFLTGDLENLPWTSLQVLDLRSNMLNGSLPWSICNSYSLDVVNLSNNNLSGALPHCEGDFSILTVLDLRMNQIHGSLPSSLSNLTNLRSLSLHGNLLKGTLPISFADFKCLEVLDLGSNQINDTFPQWLETLPNLQVLVLRSNKFHGPINSSSKARHPFPSLRIIDLSYNEFSGILPAVYFKNFQAMMNLDINRMKLRYMGNDRYSDSVIMVIKGTEITFERILTVLTTIDLSSNKFEGKIPKSIGNLRSLLYLNLSHNSLEGQIPSLLGNLTNLESLDISWNQLFGGIPQRLTALGSLEHLNLSYNHLSGPIPLGNQFNTFENDSYVGNSALCGFPLSKTCKDDKAPQPSVFPEDDDDYDFVSSITWESVLIGYGCGTILGFIIGYLMFLVGKPKWLTGIINRERHRKRRVEIRW